MDDVGQKFIRLRSGTFPSIDRVLTCSWKINWSYVFVVTGWEITDLFDRKFDETVLSQ